MLKTLSKKCEERDERLLQTGKTPPSSDDESETKKIHPVADAFYNIDGNLTMRGMTNFALDELEYLFGVVKPSLQTNFEKRGLKYIDTPFDMFFMLLCFLKNGRTCHYNAAMFRRRTSAFEKGTVWMLQLCRDTLQSKFMDRYKERYSLVYLTEKGRHFKNFFMLVTLRTVCFKKQIDVLV